MTERRNVFPPFFRNPKSGSRHGSGSHFLLGRSALIKIGCCFCGGRVSGGGEAEGAPALASPESVARLVEIRADSERCASASAACALPAAARASSRRRAPCALRATAAFAAAPVAARARCAPSSAAAAVTSSAAAAAASVPSEEAWLRRSSSSYRGAEGAEERGGGCRGTTRRLTLLDESTPMADNNSYSKLANTPN